MGTATGIIKALNSGIKHLAVKRFTLRYPEQKLKFVGDGYQFDGGSMMGEGVYFFNRVGNIIQLVEKNTKFRADKSRAIHRSVEDHIPNSIIASFE